MAPGMALDAPKVHYQKAANGETAQHDPQTTAGDRELPVVTVSNQVLSPPVTSEYNDDDWEDYIPEPPDGGWGWVVMICSFFTGFILDGIAYCFGIFLADIKAYYGSSTSATSLANSLLCGSYLLVGPIVAALSNKFGMRVVGISGSIIASVAFVLSAYSPNIFVFQLTYGIIGGFGFGMMFLPSVVGVGYYFAKKRAVATGIAVCGTGCGVMCLAPLGKMLIQVYKWQNAHLILAGLILQGCIFSALMRPIRPKKRLKKKPQDLESPHGNGTTPHSPNKEEQANLLTDGSKSILAKDQHRHRHRTTSSMSFIAGSRLVVTDTTSPADRLHASAFIQSNPTTSIQNLQKPLYRKDIFYSGSVMNVTHIKSHMSLKSYVASVTSIPQEADRLKCLNYLPKPMADILAEMLDVSILKNRGMMVLSAANVVGMLGFYVPLIFTAPRAEALGIDGNSAALLLSIQGICNTIGRAMSGFMPLIPNVSALLVNNICVTISGIAVLMTPLCTDFISMAVCSGLYGLFGSTIISLAPILMCDLVGLEKLTNGFGLLCLVRGVTAIAGPPLEGMLYDWTGNYDHTFYAGGSCLVLSGMLHFLLHLKYFKNKTD